MRVHLPMRALLVAIVVLCFLPAAALPEAFPGSGTVDLYFSPRGGATAAVIGEIEAARSEILIQAYSFTSAPIAKALIAARKRGVRVEAVLDKSNVTGRYSAATFLANEGAAVLIDAAHAIAHNKIIIVDGRTLITGSFNFTKAADEKNAENLLVFHGNPALAARYVNNYLEHKAHSAPYRRTP